MDLVPSRVEQISHRSGWRRRRRNHFLCGGESLGQVICSARSINQQQSSSAREEEKKIHFPAESECRKRSVETSAWWWHDRVMLWKCACSFFFLLRSFFLLTGRYFLGASSLYSVVSLFFFLCVTTLYKGDDGRAIKYAAHWWMCRTAETDRRDWMGRGVGIYAQHIGDLGKKEDISSCCAVYLWMM